jgi:hypothetical protein
MEKQSNIDLECPQQVNTVKNTNVGKIGQEDLIIRGVLCSVIYGSFECFHLELTLLTFAYFPVQIEYLGEVLVTECVVRLVFVVQIPSVSFVLLEDWCL